MQTSTSAVIVALLQLQAMSVNSHGEAAIAPKRQLRYIISCQLDRIRVSILRQLTPQAGILTSSAAAFSAALAAVVFVDIVWTSVLSPGVSDAAAANTIMTASTAKHDCQREKKSIVGNGRFQKRKECRCRTKGIIDKLTIPSNYQ
jgi:acetyl-CoA acetyltransferase